MIRAVLRLSVATFPVCAVGFLFAWLSAELSQAAAAESDSNPAVKFATPIATKLDYPFVAGFDRFYNDDKADAVSGGLLLIGELNCTGCHAADSKPVSYINANQAPLLGFVATRADPKYLMRFIADPHGTKPGTTMPNILASKNSAKAKATAEAITHYLASLPASLWRATGSDMTAVTRGEELFHTVGCVACHAPRRPASQVGGTSAAAAIDEDETEDRPPLDLNLASVPLSTKLHEKYSITGLASFLIDPLKIRPSGRMPQMQLSAEQANDIANYLLKDTPAPSNLRVSYYEGSWTKLPDFDRLTPKTTGGASDFSLGPLRKQNNFAVKFEGFLQVGAEGEYQFHLKSDDGSQLFIDGQLVVDNDEIHGVEHASGKVQLAAGLHPIRVTFFQNPGEAILEVSYEGPGVRRQRIPSSRLTAELKPQPGHEPFVVDQSLAERGKELFSSAGCVNCHQLGDPHAPLRSKLPAPPALASCRTEQGCLSSSLAIGSPNFSLNQRQRVAIAAAVRAIQNQQLPQRTPHSIIAATMTTLNCYACHKHDDIGGVIRERDGYFTANQPDLGDEGRIPPLLTGVGDKLRLPVVQAVLTDAAVARPYMDVRMPQFGAANVRELAAHFAAVDAMPNRLPSVSDDPAEAKRAGYQLVHANALTCVSCHMFNRQKSLGIQAMDLTLMAERLRPEWFHKYLLNPAKFRPGTRMPQSFIDGKSTKADILDGDADRQINALWAYLSDGRRARQPEGVVPQGLELLVGDEAVIYRAFIDGAGTRGIGVGYPEEVNLAYDANGMRPAIIWQGRFIDTSRHWSGRGDGFQPPAGDDVRRLVEGPPLAILIRDDQPWPKESGKQAGFQFRGYRLDELRRPTFLYDFAGIRVEDFFTGAGFGADRHLTRTVALSSTAPVDRLFFRAAAQQANIQVTQSQFKLDGGLTLRLKSSEASPIIRRIDGKHELLIPIAFRDGKATIEMEYHW